MHALIATRREEIAQLCRQFAVQRLDVFGSAARGTDFDPATSDVDFLVDFAADADAQHIARSMDLTDALAKLLGRKVDLVERRAIAASRNYIRRRHILAQAEPLYE